MFKKIFIIAALSSGLAGCTMIKMGSLFLDGRLDKTDFYAEADIVFRRGLILVPVRLNETPETFHFIFDTGAAFNVISPELARRHAAGSLASDTFVDAGGKKGKTDFTRLDRISLGDVPFDGTAAAVFDLKQTSPLRCYAADGVIGMNLIRLAPYWHVDYARRKLIFTDRENRLPSHSPVFILPFKQNIQRIPEITLEWEGLRLPFKVDLGSTHGFIATLESWEKVRSRRDAIPSVAVYGELSGGALGTTISQGRMAVVQNARCGAHRLPSLLLSLYPGAFASVGNDFFSRYAVTFDWRKKEIRLTPALPESPPLLETFGFGFSFNEKERRLYVSSLYETSPAEAAGVAIGDRILQINEKKLDSVSPDDYCRFFMDPGSLYGHEKTLFLRVESGGEQRTYTLSRSIILKESSTGHQ